MTACNAACLNWLFGREDELEAERAKLRQCTQCSQPLHPVLSGAVLVQQGETVREVCARCARDLEVFGWIAIRLATISQEP
jgi:hypothetical protein